MLNKVFILELAYDQNPSVGCASMVFKSNVYSKHCIGGFVISIVGDIRIPRLILSIIGHSIPSLFTLYAHFNFAAVALVNSVSVGNIIPL